MATKTIHDQQDERYRKLLDELLQAEEALKDQRERVAQLQQFYPS